MPRLATRIVQLAVSARVRSQTRRGRLGAFPLTPSAGGTLTGDVIRVTAIGETLPRHFRDLIARRCL
jgi:hypothetical protein